MLRKYRLAVQAAFQLLLHGSNVSSNGTRAYISMIKGYYNHKKKTYLQYLLVYLLCSWLFLQNGPPGCPHTAGNSSSRQHQGHQEQQQQQQLLYHRFISRRIVKDFTPISRHLPDLASQAAVLWPKFQAAAKLAAQHQQQDTEMDDAEVRNV